MLLALAIAGLLYISMGRLFIRSMLIDRAFRYFSGCSIRAASTRSGIIGCCESQTPVASWMALATAGIPARRPPLGIMVEVPAAALAIDDGVPVQQVDYAKLRDRLVRDKQVLAWTGPRRAGGID